MNENTEQIKFESKNYGASSEFAARHMMLQDVAVYASELIRQGVRFEIVNNFDYIIIHFTGGY